MVLLMALVIAICHVLKYICVHPWLIRAAERLIDIVLTRIVLQTFAVMRHQELFHKDDAGFDFVKAKKGELFVHRSKFINAAEPTLLLANDTSVLQWLWLQVYYSPVYVVMDYDHKTGRAGLRGVGRMELVRRACGISFPAKVDGARLFKSFRELRESMYVQRRPFVFFPECTRSNGKGVLQPPKEAIEFVKDAAFQGNFAVHALRFDYSLNSASMQPYNSTDVRGWRHALIMLTQFLNKMQIQFFFNLHKSEGWSSSMPVEDASKKVKQALFSKGREYDLDKDWHDHAEFLKYWAQNQ